MGGRGIEPLTPWMSTTCSTAELTAHCSVTIVQVLGTNHVTVTRSNHSSDPYHVKVADYRFNERFQHL